MKVEKIAHLVGGALQGDGSREIRGVAALESSGPDDLAFAEGSRAVARAAKSRAGCILVPHGCALPSRTTIAVAHPKLALIQAAEALLPSVPAPPGIHPTAVVAHDVSLGSGVTVSPCVVIQEGVMVGAGTVLGPGVFLVAIGRLAIVSGDCVRLA